MYHNPTRRCQKRQSEQIARVNAPESAQIGRPNLKATRRNVVALSKVRQNWYVYFRDGAFTFARYALFVVVPEEPFAVMVMVVVPATEAVPEMTPSEKENPDGRPDTEMLASLSADSAKRYASPFTATYRS